MCLAPRRTNGAIFTGAQGRWGVAAQQQLTVKHMLEPNVFIVCTVCVRVCVRLSEPASSVLCLLLEPQRELRSTCDQSNRRHLWQDNRVLKRLQNSYESQLNVIFHEHIKTTHVINEQNWLQLRFN